MQNSKIRCHQCGSVNNKLVSITKTTNYGNTRTDNGVAPKTIYTEKNYLCSNCNSKFKIVTLENLL